MQQLTRFLRVVGFGLLAALAASPAAAQPTTDAVFSAGFEPVGPPTRAEAARFLNQATFGATPAAIDRLMTLGYDGWFEEQFARPIAWRHAAKLDSIGVPTYCGVNKPYASDVVDSFWGATYRTNDDLRQRMVYTLSQIFVVSLQNGNLEFYSHAPPAYLDMLADNAFGNYRELIEDVTLHPAMGLYLSHMFNRKEDPASGRVPDQNYARELMQLFSIGLHELNLDGTPRLLTSGPNAGQRMPTYTQNDVVGVSRVMTGWAWSAQGNDWDQRTEVLCDKASQRGPMRAFPAYHSTSEKRFLGITIPPQAVPNPTESLRILLDRVSAHPNVGPFIGRQLIQRMVTSNPSPAYVARVASVFNNDGTGVRGNLKAVIKAVLLDAEARNPANVTRPDWGKIREPILRMAHLLRAFNATTLSSAGLTDVYSYGGFVLDFAITQQALYSPTVFNFYRPDYSPPGSALEVSGLAAPEMQIINENNVAYWTGRWSRGIIIEGGKISCCSPADYDFYFWRLNYAPYIALLDQGPDVLVDRLNELFMAGQMSPGLRSEIRAASQIQTNGLSPLNGRPRGVGHLRVANALWLLINSTEYVVQK